MVNLPSNKLNFTELDIENIKTEHSSKITDQIHFEDEFDYIDKLVRIGGYEEGDSGEQYKDFNWDWVDKDLVKEGQLWLNQNLSSFMVGAIASGQGTGAICSVTGVVMRTGAIYSIKRPLRSSLSFISWITSDLVNNLSGPAIQHMLKIRKTHMNIAKRLSSEKTPLPEVAKVDDVEKRLFEAIRLDLSEQNIQSRIKITETTLLDYNPPVLMNQLDMIISLYAISGFTIAYPERTGLSPESIKSKGFAGFIHILGIIGKIMGISDKWNFYLPYHPIDPVLGSQRLWIDIYTPALANLDPIIFAVASQVFEIRGIPKKVIMRSGFFILLDSFLEVEAKNIYEELSTVDKIVVGLFKWGMRKSRESKYWQKVFNTGVHTGAWVIGKFVPIT